jgi:hypothetical protein
MKTLGHHKLQLKIRENERQFTVVLPLKRNLIESERVYGLQCTIVQHAAGP